MSTLVLAVIITLGPLSVFVFQPLEGRVAQAVLGPDNQMIPRDRRQRYGVFEFGLRLGLMASKTIQSVVAKERTAIHLAKRPSTMCFMINMGIGAFTRESIVVHA